MLTKIIFATTNPAKVEQIRGALAPIGVAVRGVENNGSYPPVEEDGETVQENARKKAIAYARTFDVTVLSMDNALYFDALPPEEQPGIHVRRAGAAGARFTDAELLDRYIALIRKLGGRVTGHWEFGICIASPDGKCAETTIVSPRVFVATPSPKTVPGYPLESIQIDPATGKYISEMNQAERDVFWQNAIGTPLQAFVKHVEL